MKIFVTYGTGTKEEFETKTPTGIQPLENESVEEIYAESVIEKVPNLISFVEDIYRVLRPGGKATLTSPHFCHVNSWASPLTIRGIGETSLNFASKEWRDAAKFTEANIIANFEVLGQFVVDQETLARSDEAKNFWIKRYTNVAQSIIFTLNKK